jgi:hypothetical protein
MDVFSLVPALWNRPCLAVHDGKDKGLALEIGNQCYLGNDGQTMLQALPAEVEGMRSLAAGYALMRKSA